MKLHLCLIILLIALLPACDDSGNSPEKCVSSGDECNDGISCNGLETYDATADTCLPGISPCLPTEFCDPVADSCVEQCPGCRIEDTCYGDGQTNPVNPCLACEVNTNRTDWTNNDGVPCDDGLFCTTGDTCLDGGCGGAARDCDDGVLCNGTEACDEDLDTCIEGLTTCSATEVCDVQRDNCADWCPGCAIDTNCYGDGQVNPTNPCLICNLAADPFDWTLNDGVSCDDGLACTTGDICNGGTCDGTPLICDDGVACNGLEVCDEAAGGCLEGTTTCDAHEVCDAVGDRCVVPCAGCVIDTLCYGEGQINPANQCELCDTDQSPTSWTPRNGLACDDGLFCTIDDTCNGSLCEGSPRSCSDSIGCNGVETCDETTGTCLEGTTTCSSHEVCEITNDQCVVPCAGCVIDTVCYGEGEVNPANQCEICNSTLAISAWSSRDGLACDDGLFCTVSDTCSGSLCLGAPRICNDGVGCNGVETCDETLDTCLAGTTTCAGYEVCDLAEDRCVTPCAGCVIDSVCYGEGQVNPANQCERCDTALSLTSWTILDGSSCDDGLFCTTGDTCQGTVCTGTPLECSDGIECNGVESCDEAADSCVPEARPNCEADDACVDACDQLGGSLPYFVADLWPAISPTTGGNTITLVGSFGESAGATLTDLVEGLDLTIVSYTSDKVVITAPEGSLDRDVTFTAADALPVPYLKQYIVSGQRAFTQEATIPLDYENPVLTAVHGCMDVGNTTTECPNIGGNTLTLEGSNFGDDSSAITVEVGDQVCDNITISIPHQTIICTLPGSMFEWVDLPVTVTVGGRSDTMNGALSYMGPTIDTFTDITDLDPLGGYHMTLTGRNFEDGATVRYGPTGIEFECTNVIVTVLSSEARQLECDLGPGVGAGLVFTVQYGMQTSLPTTSTVSYASPVILEGTLRATEEGAGATSLTLSSLPSWVWFNVANIPQSHMYMVNVVYTDGIAEQECLNTVITTDATSTRLGCLVTTNLSSDNTLLGTSRFEIRVPGDTSGQGSDTLSYPASCPLITDMYGCPGYDGTTTYDCPTMGGTTLYIVGTGFTSDAQLLIDGLPVPYTLSSGTTLSFNLPESVGSSSARVQSDGCSSNILSLDYAAPRVTGVYGCPGNDDGKPYDCSTSGATVIYIEGSNFGASGATVLIGGTPCTSVIHHFATPHTKLSCLLPAGSGVDLPVTVINGHISETTGTLSYATP